MSGANTPSDKSENLAKLIKGAISQTRQVSFIYHGDLCIVRPLAYGHHKRLKEIVIQAVQVGGLDADRNRSRLFEIRHIQDLRMMPDRFFQNPAQPADPSIVDNR